MACDDLRIFIAGDDEHQGCPVLSKRRIVVIPRGIQGIIRWQVRNRQGTALNLSECICNTAAFFGTTTTTPAPCGQVIFRFSNAFPCTAETAVVHQIIGDGYDVTNGWVQVEMSAQLANSPGIWQFELAITDAGGVPQVIDRGMISVEHGVFPTVDPQKMVGPPTINEIRIHLRDTAFENDLLGDVEFDDAEILACIVRPIQQWNEQPPDVAYFTTENFPFRHHWLDAISARLLRIAAHWYRRNKFNSSQGGINVADRDKEMEYLRAAKELDDAWRAFMMHKKLEINIGLSSGSIGSSYGSGYGR